LKVWPNISKRFCSETVALTVWQYFGSMCKFGVKILSFELGSYIQMWHELGFSGVLITILLLSTTVLLSSEEMAFCASPATGLLKNVARFQLANPLSVYICWPLRQN